MILISWLRRRLHWDHTYPYAFRKEFYTSDSRIDIRLCRESFCSKWQIITSSYTISSSGTQTKNIIADDKVPVIIQESRIELIKEKRKWVAEVQKRKNWREMKYPKPNIENIKHYCVACGEDQSNNDNNDWELGDAI